MYSFLFFTQRDKDGKLKDKFKYLNIGQHVEVCE